MSGLSPDEVEVFAETFSEANAAQQVLKSAGLPVSRHPAWGTNDALGFWAQVSGMLEKGALTAGRAALMKSALRLFPDNQVFKAGAAGTGVLLEEKAARRSEPLAIPTQGAGPDRDLGGTGARPSAAVRLEPLANPLDQWMPLIRRFLDRLFRSERAPELKAGRDPSSLLDFLRGGLEATGALEIDLDGSSVRVVASSGDLDEAAISDRLREAAPRFVYDRSVLGYLGARDEKVSLLFIPLATIGDPAGHLLVFVDPASAFLELGEPLVTVLTTLWRILPTRTVVEAEVAVLTALRDEFGRLPLPLYRAALNAYGQVLGSLLMVFEPVMEFSSRYVGIHSWEALARRDENDRKAPFDVLAVAAKWGDEFVIERDKTLARKAISTYVQAHARSQYSIDNPGSLSINVSVRSLLSRAYELGLKDAISEAGLPPRRVTLEISERDPIEPRAHEKAQWTPTPMAHFQTRLSNLSRRLHVNFAVDDFGVGYASLDRVANLPLTEIKVDRAILHHSLALKELELVMGLANEALDRGQASSARVVVVEGFDKESPVSLRDLHELGIHFVQGYITEEPASAELRPLSASLQNRIAKLLSPKG